MKNSEIIENNSKTTLEPLMRWIENYSKKAAPERIVESHRLMDRTSRILITELAAENLKMFGTPLPKHPKTDDEAAFDFDEAYYTAHWKPLFGKFVKICESEVEPGDDHELIKRVMRYMKEHGFTRDFVKKSLPYCVRFFNDAYDEANNL